MVTLGDGRDGGASMLRAVLDATRLLVLVVDRDGTVRLVNDAAQRVMGVPEAAGERPLWELALLPAESASLRGSFTPFDAGSLPSGMLFHLRCQAPDGTITSRVVDWDVRVVDAGTGTPFVVLAGIDVSDRLAVERQLRESEELHRRVLDRLPAIVWTTDKELRFTFSAGGALGSLALAPGQVAMAGTSLFNYFHTEDRAHPGIAPHVRALQGESSVFEMEWLDHLFQSRVEPLRDRSKGIIGTIGLAVDVTEQTRTAKALRTSEAHLRRLVDANVIGVIFWDETGRITEANEAFLEIVGFSREELLSGAVSWRAMTPAEEYSIDEGALAEIRATGRCAPYEKHYVAKDGTPIPVLVGAASFDGGKGPMVGVAFIIDLREQARLREARDQLLVQEQRARIETELANARLLLLVEGSKRLARTLNPTDTLQTLATLAVPGLADWTYVIHRGWNDGPSMVASAHGDPNRSGLLRRLHNCQPDPDSAEGAPKVFRTGELAQYEDVKPEQLMPGAPGGPIVGTRNPEYLQVLRELGMKSFVCVPITGRGGGVDGVLMLVSASDPRRYAEEDLVLARDLAGRAAVSLENGRLLFEALDAVRARDEFLAVAAHELRTPLTSLLLHLQMLERAVEHEEPDAQAAQRGVAAASGQARRLSALVNGLLDVARLASHRMWLQLEPVDLRALIDGLATTMAHDLQRAGCRLDVTMPDEPLTGRWDRVRLEQVLTNILTNAMKFGAGHPIELLVEATDDDVAIAIQDHGIGISKEDQHRIFSRFERAVSSRHFGGLGLGLYIAAQILHAHQGSIRVESEPGQGACFIVELPRNVEQAAVSSQEERRG